MIEKLTKEQENLIPILVEKWIKIGMRTGRADRAKTEQAIRDAYAVAKLKPPSTFEWFDSPLAGIRAASKIAGTGSFNQLNQCGYGSHDAPWLGFYEFWIQIGMKGPERLKPLMTLAEEIGWWWPFKDHVIITERPIRVETDPQGRLHCANQMAIEYLDGWGVYAWHGVRVPMNVIKHPELITVNDIDAEKNAEIRRVMIARYTPERYMRDVGHQLINKDDFGELYRSKNDILMVKVINSTPDLDGSQKPYWLPVDPECRPLLSGNQLGDPQKLTARNAIASTFGLRGEEYAPSVET